ncbi:MAG: hypothetical protein U0R50_07150 [Gaiellales bacterium]
MPYFICPNCRERSVDHDGLEGFSTQAAQCRSCGFGFLFQLLDDYYPAPSTGFVVCDAKRRVLGAGRGVFELTGFREADLMGRDVIDVFGLSERGPFELVEEWGVRQLGKRSALTTRAGLEKRVTLDLFPGYDEDGGLLVALTQD